MRFISLRTKLIVATICLILLPLFLVGIYTYNEFEDVLARNIAQDASERLQQINMNIERELKAMVNASSSVVLDENIRNVLEEPPSNDRETLSHVKLIDDKVLEISTAVVSDEVYITIIDNFGHFYTNWPQSPDAYERIRKAEFYRKAEAQNGYMVWELNHANYIDPNDEQMVTLAMMIRDNSFSRNIGMLILSEPVDTPSH